MQPVAKHALEELWKKADRAALRLRTKRAVLPLTPASFPSYLELATRAEKEEFHAQMREAERAGAISIDWDKRAGKDGQILRLVAESQLELGRLIGKTATTDKLRLAESALREWQSGTSRVAELLQAWREGRSPRGVSVDRLQDVLDALRLIHERTCSEFRDESERRVSARLFGDSKRIERIVVAIDILTAHSVNAEARQAEAVLASLGLVKFPVPLLLCGTGEVQVSNAQAGTRRVEILDPYIGLEPRRIFGVVGEPGYILSVENLTIFHELANRFAGEIEGLVIYTGGFPSPSMVNAYKAIVRTAPANALIYHWGDTDLGGFRIANLMATACLEEERHLLPWMMAATDSVEGKRPLSKGEVQKIAGICERWKWHSESEVIQRNPIAVEQELQPLSLPAATVSQN